MIMGGQRSHSGDFGTLRIALRAGGRMSSQREHRAELGAQPLPCVDLL